MENNFKKLLSLVIALVMVVGMIPGAAFAAETNEAEVNGVEYATLQEAIDAAGVGDTVTLLTDLTFESDLNNAAKGYFNVAADDKITLDLNGKTINITDNSTGNFIVFYSYGELTLKNGTVNLTATNDRDWNAESAIVLNRGGILNVESGVYTHNGGTDMAFVLDNSGNYYGDATTNIYDGTTLTSSYIAIRNRMEQNTHGASGTTYLNVYGGTISGTSRAIWAQAASTSETAPASGEIVIKGGNVGLIDTPRSTGAVSMTTIEGGTVSAFKGEIGELTVTGGTLGTVTMLNTSGEEVAYTVNGNGQYVEQPVVTTEAELAAALATSGTVTLGGDIEVTNPITIPAGAEITLDLAGHTITGALNGSSTTNHIYVINNYGTWTVNDSVGTGKIVSRGVYNYGDWTLNNGTIEACDGNGGYAVNNESGSTFTMNGGSVVATYDDDPTTFTTSDATPIDVCAGNTTTINGGTVSSKSNWVYAISVSGTLNITNTKGNVQVNGAHGAVATTGGNTTIEGGTFVCDGATNASSDHVLYVSSGSLTVNNGTFTNNNYDAGSNGAAVCLEGGSAVINDGSFTGCETVIYGNDNTTVNGGSYTLHWADRYDTKNTLVQYVATNATVTVDGVKYVKTENGLEDSVIDTEAELAAALAAGGTVTLGGDIEVTNTITVPAGVTATLDLAGHTISQQKACTDHYTMINNKGTLTVTGNGKISFTDTGAGDPEYHWGSYTLSNHGTLVVENGTIENLSQQNAGSVKHMYCAIQQGSGAVSTTINGGTISTPTYRSVRINAGALIVNGGTFVGQIWMQPNQGNTTLEITGGSFAPAGSDGSSVFMTNVGENYTVTSASISGGYFATKIGCSDATALAGCITGGTCSASAVANTNPALLNEAYTVVENDDGSYSIVSSKPELPTATVTKLQNEDLTFALNFLANEPSEEIGLYYQDWYADFELTVNKDVTFNANGGADGYLSGQYDEWSENWVNVPFEDVTLKAGETLKIMEYAAKAMGKPGLKLTYADVYLGVKEFNCGIFLEPAFIAANPDLEITLELRMYNNEDETETYVIGDTYTYSIPTRPTATTKEVENEDLTFAMNFVADKVTTEQLDFYGNWYADFELTVNKDVTFNANGGADGYLSGQYDKWSENWVNVPFKDVTLNAGETLKIMEYAAELMGEPGLKYTYKEVYEAVKDFDCGVFLEPAFIAANPDLEITLELRMYNNLDETESYTIGETYVFTIDYVAYNTVTETLYDSAEDALLAAKAGETVTLLKDTGADDGKNYFHLIVQEDVVFDLNGYTVTAEYMSSFGNTVDNSEANTGAVAVTHLMIQPDNEQITVKTAKGFQFFEVEFILDQFDATRNYYAFVPMIEAAGAELLAPGVAVTGVSIQVNVSWKTSDGHTRNQLFVFSDEYVNGFIASYDPEEDWYGKMFTLTLNDTTGITDLSFTAYVVSDTGVKYPA